MTAKSITAKQAQEARWFLIGAAFHILILCPAFFAWAPWTTAISTARAAEEYPGRVDPQWRAVHVNHGHPHEWRFGTIRQNPAGFAACSAALSMGLAGFLYCTHRARQIQRS